jgi:hypothetical protein
MFIVVKPQATRRPRKIALQITRRADGGAKKKARKAWAKPSYDDCFACCSRFAEIFYDFLSNKTFLKTRKNIRKISFGGEFALFSWTFHKLMIS